MKIYVALFIINIVLIAIIVSYIFIELAEFILNSTIEISPTLSVTAGEYVVINLPKIRKYDRIYLVIDGFVNVDEIHVYPSKVFQLPLRVEAFEHDVFPTLISEKRYLFIVNDESENASIYLRLQPLVPFIIKNVEGFQRYLILSNCSGDLNLMCISLFPVKFHVNNYSQIMLIHPYRQRVQPDFKINGVVKIIQGRVDYINIVIMTEKQWYAYKVVDVFSPPNTSVKFEINAYTIDIFGKQGEFLGEDVIAVAVAIGISRETYKEHSNSIIGVGELVIHNGDSTYKIEPEVRKTYVFNPKIYVLRKYQPSNNYIVSIASLTILINSFAVLIAKIVKGDLS